MKLLKSAFLGMIALLPGSAFAEQYRGSTFQPKKPIQMVFQEGQTVDLIIRNQRLKIDYKNLRSAMGLKDHSFKQSIGVQIHEEENVVDLSDFNGLVVTVPIEHISDSRPNQTTGDR